MQESASFWTDIKNLEDQLSKSPDSFCFARLSEVYLKVGLVDDALHVARRGVAKHPAYLSGQRALSLACHAKGLNDEALVSLQAVTEAMPEDLQSQKLLGRLHAEAGNQDAARQAFRTVLEFAPDDMECRIELDSLERLSGVAEKPLDADDDDDEVIEDLEILEEVHAESEIPFKEALPETGAAASLHDPLSTGTLAELYVSQGFIYKALEIYRAILAENPADQATAERVAALEILENVTAEAEAGINDNFEEDVEEESASGISPEVFFQEPEPETLSESVFVPEFECRQTYTDVSTHTSDAPVVFQKGTADNALSMLDGWLENIRRIKSCR